MDERIRRSLSTGITRVKWIANYIAQRTRAEKSSARLLYKAGKLERDIEVKYRDLGKRLAELREKGDKDEKEMLSDLVIKGLMDEIEYLKTTAEDYRKQAAESNRNQE